jgi:hypothetical protein
MKTIINKIARYIIGIWGLALVLLLACMFQEGNSIADRILTVVFALFFVLTIVLFLTYAIHLIWMMKEKRKPQNLKSDIIDAVLIVLALTVYDVYSNQFAWNDIWKRIVFVLLAVLSGEIARYIYSWRE